MATYKPWMTLIDISRKVRWTLESEGIITYGFDTLILVFRDPSCCGCKYTADGGRYGRGGMRRLIGTPHVSGCAGRTYLYIQHK